MKIAIMATGGVGGYFGARLAKGNYDVSFIARGAHLDAIRQKGVKVESPLGDLHLTNVKVTQDPCEIGPVDIIIFAVKLGDMELGAEFCKPLLSDHTAVIPLLNGVEATTILTKKLGAKHACGGVAYIFTKISTPGCIVHESKFARMIFGEIDGQRSNRLKQFEAACTDSGIETIFSNSITVAIWEKFSVLVPLSGLTAGSRSPVGSIRSEPLGRDVFASALEEVIAVGKAKGIALPDDLKTRQLRFFNDLSEKMKASMLIDLEAGKALEAPWLSGAVSRMGREVGVSTPINDTLFTILQPHIMGKI